ncbi:PP2C family serine/threonine-protein phosphatase [Micromonospora sp. NPDC023633]|uniref:PP2C family protein-serine/threonine phosphatase n=1 Tax=Micromonospora sp. NPDC023633 TaxID=3154320 RepID=UPI00340DBE48
MTPPKAAAPRGVAVPSAGHADGSIRQPEAPQALRRYDQEVEPDTLAVTLGQVVSAASYALQRQIQAEPELAGMGTTLVAMLISGTAAALANVGDSRAYLVHGQGPQHGQTIRITEDHVYQRLVADAADVPNPPERLTRFLVGRADGRPPDITLLTLKPGDRFLLCSDGLSSYVPEDLLHAVLASAPTPAEAVEGLSTAAFDHGGPDNSRWLSSTSMTPTDPECLELRNGYRLQRRSVSW